VKRIIILFLAAFFFLVPSADAQIYTTDKMITVDTGSQTLRAWQDGRVQMETKVSTGMKYTPTVKGSFKIRRKVPLQDMKGIYPPYPPYHIKNVPHVMYFYGAYAIHGTYWHNSFGYRASHGCVNVPLTQAEWLFNWAHDGTRVEVF
jgi:lipoprotein-anchoring transpeptidase ErfK/SrfK